MSSLPKYIKHDGLYFESGVSLTSDGLEIKHFDDTCLFIDRALLVRIKELSEMFSELTFNPSANSSYMLLYDPVKTRVSFTQLHNLVCEDGSKKSVQDSDGFSIYDGAECVTFLRRDGLKIGDWFRATENKITMFGNVVITKDGLQTKWKTITPGNEINHPADDNFILKLDGNVATHTFQVKCKKLPLYKFTSMRGSGSYLKFPTKSAMDDCWNVSVVVSEYDEQCIPLYCFLEFVCYQEDTESFIKSL